ncbi:MAG TPA: MBOAT family O-acyltransferase [Geminicoccaceae bacterium]|nr:MBOAT family O-acyltransferase [Geminicoccaceae bacterium]
MSVVSLSLFGWMVFAVAPYWALPDRLRAAWLSGVTFAFLVVHAPLSAAILLGFAAATHGFTRSDRVSGKTAFLLCAAIVLVLVLYKLRVSVRFTDALTTLAIPLGLSYYALRCVHYVIERYKGTLAPQSAQDIGSYLFFLPTLLAGPIHRYAPFHRDAARRRWDSRLFGEGLERMLYGYVKIAFLSNYVVSQGLSSLVLDLQASHPSASTYLSVIERGLNGYLQFSGYSDIAIGFGMLLGYRVMENFNWPFVKKNISEFWKSWHISLSSWCRDYVYMVVVALSRRPALAALASMLAIGLWHEISCRYLLWGLYNGLGIVAWQQFQRLKPMLPRIESPAAALALDAAAVLLTFHFVILGFVLVTEPTLGDVLTVYRSLFQGWP